MQRIRKKAFVLACLLTFSFLDASLQKEVDQFLDKKAQDINCSVAIYSLEDNAYIYQKNLDKRFVPASTIKLFTSACANHNLGPDYKLSTELYLDGKMEQDRLVGDLYLLSSGDPTFSTKNLEELVCKLIDRNIYHIDGDFNVDQTCFDDIQMGPGWMWDEEPGFWNAPLTGFMLDHNCIEITRNCEDGTFSFVNPPLNAPFQIVKQSETITKCSFLEELGYTPTYWVNDKASVSEFIPMRNTIAITDKIIRRIFQKNHIGFTGVVAAKSLPKAKVVKVAMVNTELKKLYKPILQISDNLYSDALFKILGKFYTKNRGSFASGKRAMDDFLQNEIQLNLEELKIVDGSGLSRYNQLSSKHLIELLKWISKQENHSVVDFLQSYQIVDNRLKVTNQSGVVQAKTGSMTGVCCFCGFIESKHGKKYAFSILLNGYVKPLYIIRKEIQDQLCILIRELL